jgi:hypothetical protein
MEARRLQNAKVGKNEPVTKPTTLPPTVRATSTL